MEENRKRIRHTLKKRVDVIVQDSTYRGTVFNLTEGGCYIQVKGPHSIGDLITIKHQLDGGPIGEIRRTGTIKQVTETGVGIEFKKKECWE